MFKASKNMIVESVQKELNGKNVKVGVFIGKLNKGKLIAGFSHCRIEKGDVFDMQKGIDLAVKNGVNGKKIPVRGGTKEFRQKYEEFMDRCLRYFKGWDFNGRTSVDYSKKNKETNPLKAAPELENFVRMQLRGMGLEGKMIDDFVKYGLPVVQELKKKGVAGIAIPLSDAWGFEEMAVNIGKAMASVSGVPLVMSNQVPQESVPVE
jgi:hypothetical protein